MKTEIKSCMPDLLSSLQTMLSEAVYAKDWLVMNMLQLEMTVKVCQKTWPQLRSSSHHVQCYNHQVLEFYADHRPELKDMHKFAEDVEGASLNCVIISPHTPTLVSPDIADADDEDESPNSKSLDDQFFEIGLLLLLEPALDLKHPSMTEARRHFIEDVGKYGDMRLQVAGVLQKCWENLSDERLQLIDLMVKPLLELVQSSSEEVSSVCKALQ